MISWAEAWHGVGWPCRRDDGETSPSLMSLVRAPLRFDPRGIAEAWGQRAVTREHTVIAGVQRRSPLLTVPIATVAFEEALVRSVESIAARARAPALALGGGLDAAAVLAAWREVSARPPTVLTLATGLRDYDEVEEARSIASAFGCAIEVVSVPASALADLVPPAVLAAETPLHGLHPVARFALARAAATRGHDVLVTGDGADAAFRGEPDLDYVPIVAALTDAAGLSLRSPFLFDAVLAAIAPSGVDKAPLRTWLARRGAPAWLVARDKIPRSLPAIDLRALPMHELPLEAPPPPVGHRGIVSRVTLGILADALRRRAG